MNRYAIYYAPGADDPLHAAGVSWLGRDALSGQASSVQANAAYSTDEMAEFTAPPRRYGFHATLRPPAPLVDGTNEQGFIDAVVHICEQALPFEMPALAVSGLDHLVAIVPRGDAFDLDTLAARMVRGLDWTRRPYTAEEQARRAGPHLTPQQRELLTTWGDPNVLDAFRFHMTLSRRLASHSLPAVLDAAQQHFDAALTLPRTLDEVSIFIERDAPADLVELCRVPLGLRPG